MKVYLVEGDNGEPYEEDQTTWVEGIFANRAAAHIHLIELGCEKIADAWTIRDGKKVAADEWREAKGTFHRPWYYEVTEWEVMG